MKKIVCALLACILLALSVPMCVSAEEGKENITADDLYITEGLTVFCDAFDGNSVPTGGTWQGKVGSANLLGLWMAEADGKGITYANSSSLGYGSLVGVEVSPALLGEGSYTVEAMIAPKGLTDIDTGERYVDTLGSIQHDFAVDLGPFKAMGYPALSTPTTSLSLHYYYSAQGGYASVGHTAKTWNSFLGMGMQDAFTYSIDHTSFGTHSVYSVKNNGLTANTMVITEEEFVPLTSSTGRARLFCYFPITLYSLRVYNRVLSDAERAQNHFADLCNYHGVEPSDFWHLLSEEEKQSLIEDCAHLAFYDGAHAFGAIISSYLYTKTDMPSAFCAVAEAYGLDILALLDHAQREQIAVAMSDIASGFAPDAVQKELDLRAEGKNVADALLSFDKFGALSQEEPEFAAFFDVDSDLLALLSRNYTVSYGALAGLSSVYTDIQTLTLTADGKAPANAVRYDASEAKQESFSLTVFWPQDKQNEKDYKIGIYFRGYVCLTDASGAKTVLYDDAIEEYEQYDQLRTVSAMSALDAAKYFVCERVPYDVESYALYKNQALRSVLNKFRYTIPTWDESIDENRLITLQYELQKGLEEALSVEDVLYCKGGKAANGDSIWVEYLADSVQGDDRIRPAYIYFPTDRDPSSQSVGTLKTMGVLRVFCYIGMPKGTGEVPGLLCVHGGGGHAYINYVKEAVNHGYAAIAIDADGYTRSSPTAPDSTGGYSLDQLSIAKDSLEGSDRDIEEQWMYYVQRALIYTNTVLRSFDRVKDDCVGITGISWGGLTTTIAIGYDTRYAFAVPVYLSGNMDESMGSWSADYFERELWYNDEPLKNATMPVLVLNSDGDKFASLNTSVLTYHDLPNAQMCIIHELSHSQQRGASLSEIYAFGDYVLGYSEKMPRFMETPDESFGSSYTLTVAQNDVLDSYMATLYYLTEPVTYGDGTNAMRSEWKSVELAVTDGKVEVNVPDDACVYYVSLTAYYWRETYIPTVYIKYTGYITSSTPLISMSGMYR